MALQEPSLPRPMRRIHLRQLPTEIDEKSYTVLDTSEGLVMLHVNHGAKEASRCSRDAVWTQLGFYSRPSMEKRHGGADCSCYRSWERLDLIVGFGWIWNKVMFSNYCAFSN